MNIQQLNHTLKTKWLLYYRQNRSWLIKLRIWSDYDGHRRPSSSFILATLTNLEPQLIEMLPFIMALSNDPDQIIVALGLNFNPEEELKSLTKAASMMEIAAISPIDKNYTNGNGSPQQAVPKIKDEVKSSPLTAYVLEVPPNTVSSLSKASNFASWVDESCEGAR